MKARYFLLALLSIAAKACALQLVQSIPLPGVKGRIDHMAVDTAGRRLFIAALGNNTVEIVDLRQGKVVHSILGLDEPQGVAYAPKSNRIVVANGGDGSVKIFDGTSYRLIKALDMHSDADNVRYESSENRIYVGYGSGGIAVIDPDSGVAQFTIELSGHPESFQLESKGRRIFVNVPDENEIDVLDREKKSILTHWSLGHLRSNFPMALDEADHRLFVGVRGPAVLMIFDTETGRSLAQVPIGGDVDDVFLDPKTRSIFLSCGEGFLDVVHQTDPDHYVRIEHVPTSKGARTGFFLLQAGKLYLAVPARGAQQAELRVYSTIPDAK